MSASSNSSAAVSEKEQQKIIDGFQKLREQQTNTLQEMAKLQAEYREHA
jgi:hypothetical protein